MVIALTLTGAVPARRRTCSLEEGRSVGEEFCSEESVERKERGVVLVDVVDSGILGKGEVGEA